MLADVCLHLEEIIRRWTFANMAVWAAVSSAIALSPGSFRHD